MDITEEMLDAFLGALPVGQPFMRANLIKGFEAAAPLIAAQALRSVDADRIAQAIGDPGSIVGRRVLPWRDGGEDGGQGETVTRWATRAVLAVLAACPTCSGPTRETVGMVCQTCGTDYAPDAS